MPETLTGFDRDQRPLGAVASPACHDGANGRPGKRLTADVWARSARLRPPGGLRSCSSCRVVVFVLPALFGHPVVAGDNQIQNYPLRVLSGQMLQSGPPASVGPVDLVRVAVARRAQRRFALSGHLALRGASRAGRMDRQPRLSSTGWQRSASTCSPACTGLRPLASVIGAASFAFAGSMTAQMVHLGVVQGAAWIPWMVAGELRLAQTLPARRRKRPIRRRRMTATAARSRRAAGADGAIALGAPRRVAAAVSCSWPASRARWPTRLGSVRCVPSWWVTRRARSEVAVSLCGGSRSSLRSPAPRRSRLHSEGRSCFRGSAFCQTTQRSTASLSYFGSGSLQPRWSVLASRARHLRRRRGPPPASVLRQLQPARGHRLRRPIRLRGALHSAGALDRALEITRLARTWSVWLVVLVVGLAAQLRHVHSSRRTALAHPVLRRAEAPEQESHDRRPRPRDAARVLGGHSGDARVSADATARPAHESTNSLVRRGGSCARLRCRLRSALALLVVPTRLETALGMTGLEATSARGSVAMGAVATRRRARGHRPGAPMAEDVARRSARRWLVADRRR